MRTFKLSLVALVLLVELAHAQLGVGINHNTTISGTGSVASPYGVNTSLIQARVTGACTPPATIVSIAADGTVVCSTNAIDGTGTNNTIAKWTPDGNSLGNSLLTDNVTTLSYNAGKFTVTAATGNTTVAGTLGVTGIATIGATVVDTGLPAGSPAAYLANTSGYGLVLERAGVSNSAERLALYKTRGATVDVRSALANGDTISSIVSLGATDSSSIPTVSAEIDAVVNGTVSTNILPTELRFYTTTTAGALTLGCTLSTSQVLNCVGGMQENGSAVLSGAISTNRIPKGSSSNLADSSITDDGSIVSTAEDGYIGLDTGTGAKRLSIGRDTTLATNAQNGLSFIMFSDGSNYIDSKTITGGSTIFRYGAGGVAGSNGTWLTVTNATGATNFASAMTAATTLAVNGNTTLGDAVTDATTINGVLTITEDLTGATATITPVAAAASTWGFFGQVNGTIDTTGAQRASYGVIGESYTTRSAGAFPLVTYGGYFDSIGGQTAYAVYADRGLVQVNGNATLGDASTDTLTVSGYAGFGITPNSSYQVLVDTGRQYAISATSTPVAEATNDLVAIGGTAQGTYNTTSSGRFAYGVRGLATATRSSGANNLTNVALYGHAVSGQLNWGLWVDAGDSHMDGNAFVNGNSTLGDTPASDTTTNNGSLTISGPTTDTLIVKSADATTDIFITKASTPSNQGYIRYDDTAQDLSLSVGAAADKDCSLTGAGVWNCTTLTEGGAAVLSGAITANVVPKGSSGNLVDSSITDPGTGVVTMTSDLLGGSASNTWFTVKPRSGNWDMRLQAAGSGNVKVNYDSGTNGVLFYDGATNNVASISSAGTASFNGNVSGNGSFTIGSNSSPTNDSHLIYGPTLAKMEQTASGTGFQIDAYTFGPTNGDYYAFTARVLDGAGINTTAGAVNVKGVVGIVSAARTSGANTLTNTAATFTATNGTVNYALVTGSGDVDLNTSGGVTTAEQSVTLNNTAGTTTVKGAATFQSTLDVTGALNGYKQVTKPSDQDVTNSATLTDDTALTFAVTAGKAYAVEMLLMVSDTNAANDHAFRVASSAGTQDGTGVCHTVTTADAIQDVVITAAAAANTNTVSVGTRTNIAIPIAVYCTYSFLQNTTGGNFKLQFAQAVAAAATSARTMAGSWMKWKQLN